MRQPTVRALLVCGALLAAAPALSAQQRVSFPTADGGLVTAELYGDGPRAVVLAHGGRFDAASWAPQARALAEAGFRTLAIDFRGRGGSHGGSAGPDGARFDVLAAIRYLRETGAHQVAVVGASFGGGAAAEAAVAAPREIDALVLLAHSAIEDPERLAGPTLFLVGRGDRSGAGVSRLQSVREQFERAGGEKELVVIESDAHAQFLFETPEGERVLAEIVRFLHLPIRPAGGAPHEPDPRETWNSR